MEIPDDVELPFHSTSVHLLSSISAFMCPNILVCALSSNHCFSTCLVNAVSLHSKRLHMVVLQLFLARTRVSESAVSAMCQYCASFSPTLPYPLCWALVGANGCWWVLTGAIDRFHHHKHLWALLAQLLQGSKVQHVVLVSQLEASSHPSGLAGLLWSASPLAAVAEVEAALAAAVAAGGDRERGAAGEARRQGFGSERHSEAFKCQEENVAVVVAVLPPLFQSLWSRLIRSPPTTLQASATRGSVSREDLAAMVAAALAVPLPPQHRRIIEVGVWVGGTCWVG
ncbi:unnamed protein product [Closterium sp. Naga37s-1]|nr:unnamed protein product [Closterium sp. Naga37s-1]